MSLKTDLGNRKRWPGAENFYGGADLSRDLAGGKSAAEIQRWASRNADKIRSKETWNMINSLKDSPKRSSGGGGSSRAGRSENVKSIEIPRDNPLEREETEDITEIKKGYFTPTVEDFKDIISKGGGQNVFQSAIQDNRMSNIGNNSVFGDNAQVGINNAVQNVNQSVDYGLDLERRSSARDRAKEWLALSALAG